MPAIFFQHQANSNKNNTYHGITLLLSLLFLLWRSPQAQSSPVEQFQFKNFQVKDHKSQVRQLQADSSSSNDSSNNLADIKIEQDLKSEFGSKGQKHWYLQGAAATTLDNNESSPGRFALAGAGLSKFLFDGHSINLELNTIYFNQPEDDALGLNLALLMRWHFVRQSSWSLYLDGGAGVMGTTSDVPSKGASFNFTPQLGGGATIKLKNERRLMLGLRWHHISHADLFGANPGRDSLLGYVGLQLPR